MTMQRCRKETIDEFKDLLEACDFDGPINNRAQTVLIAALRSTPVREALVEAFIHFSENYDDAKRLAGRS